MTSESSKISTEAPVGAVLVVGGGIAGVQAALDAADAGFHVHLVESSPAIGGRMAQLDKTFPTNDCSMCILSPKLVECGRHLDIDVLTCAELIGLEGEPGRFTARIRRRARYVDINKCTGCGDCLQQCPVRYQPRFRVAREPVRLSEDEDVLVGSLIAKHGRSRSALLRVMQEVNAALHYLPAPVLQRLADEFAVPLSVLYRIGTFYTAFSLTPRGRHTISVCTGTACHIKGAPKLVEELQRELGIAVGGTTPDSAFSLQTVRCLGCCALAPVVKVDNRIYGGVKSGDISKIVKDHI